MGTALLILGIQAMVPTCQPGFFYKYEKDGRKGGSRQLGLGQIPENMSPSLGFDEF
jgi:hypothetical protein